jgi:putative redox protein
MFSMQPRLFRGLVLAKQARSMATGSPKHVTAAENRNTVSNFSISVQSGTHTLQSDVLTAAGGANMGPSPKELLMSALGSCTAMTIRVFYENSVKTAKAGAGAGAAATTSSTNLGWENSTLENVNVVVEEKGDHPHVPSALQVSIKLFGNLSEEQRARLVRAASNCPVKKIITGSTTVETTEV